MHKKANCLDCGQKSAVALNCFMYVKVPKTFCLRLPPESIKKASEIPQRLLDVWFLLSNLDYGTNFKPEIQER